MEPFRQHEFGWRVALDFLLSGTGSSMFIIYFLSAGSNRLVYMLGPVFILAGLAVLLSELGKPSNFWRSIYNYKTSWMARGAIFNILYILVWLAMILAYILNLYAFPLYAIEFALSILVLIYPVMLLQDVKDIKLWKNGWSSVMTAVYAISGGASLDAFIISLYQPDVLTLAYISLGISLLALVLLFAYISALRREQYKSIEYSLRQMLEGDRQNLLKLSFSGVVVQFAMDLLFILNIPAKPFALLVGFAFSMAGVYSFRLMLLNAGFHEPLISDKRIKEITASLKIGHKN
ncbi:MAG: dimethyl sulfoxide reductase anchor subunit [Nitrososphaerota archaeon]|jgi:formate-dependent nitrite reductase membrane component NrfD|nr:hypothetical protein [Nitrososphaerota archaeon]MDG6927310.1 dimethyl sulfoxide reductase anchor subunit [Nitrososphaerota archaeon]MDG6930332.1 dimethyl sulfoxide reductase anchor subunit [Nitrososphaerota archaeon]MDG6931688.1 dimethyl sulfoxide reductase anchor subunit [Nitrososphaerota archaeon]MDG6936736.1 dimethyl sulfoxide reductase anchor subunit [Nitrososphaerota archaeon]